MYFTIPSSHSFLAYTHIFRITIMLPSFTLLVNNIPVEVHMHKDIFKNIFLIVINE